MSTFRDLVTGGKNEFSAREKAVKSIAADYPLVAEVLSGSPASGSIPEVSGGSVSFYLDGGQMKFTIFVKSPEMKFFGVVQDVANPWGSINSALLVGDVSRKRHTEQAESNGKVPY